MLVWALVCASDLSQYLNGGGGGEWGGGVMDPSQHGSGGGGDSTHLQSSGVVFLKTRNYTHRFCTLFTDHLCLFSHA